MAALREGDLLDCGNEGIAGFEFLGAEKTDGEAQGIGCIHVIGTSKKSVPIRRETHGVE
jgi:hypothetical protein